MYGPPKGHNIKLYLDFFQHNSNTYKLTYVFTGKQRYPLNEFSNITFIDYKKDFFQFLKLVISGFRGFELYPNRQLVLRAPHMSLPRNVEK